MATELDPVLYERITAITNEGNRLADEKNYIAAKEKFWSAFDLLPAPKFDWEATTWILASIGDMWFLMGDLTKAEMAFVDAVGCPGGLGTPFIHLRLGEIAFESGDMKRAANELTRVYMGGGRDAFKREDPKYFRFLETILKPPRGSNRL